MKRIIITENQYKKLVSQPLNEQKDKGGELIFADGYSFDDLTSEMILFLNKLLGVLRVKYKKSVYIKKVKNHILTINLSRYNKKQIKTIKYVAERYFNSSEFLDDRYDNEKGEMFFAPDFYKLDEPEEIEDVTIEDPEEIEDDSEESDGICESGDCENDRGVYRYTNGDVYDGIFVNGKLDVGTYTYENGDVYAGTFVDDTFNGDGIFIDKETNIEYEGIWGDGELINNALIHYPNGDEYEGDVGSIDEGLKPDGYGKMFYYCDGCEENYVGDWVDGKKNGQGTYTFADGRIMEGIWEDDNIKDGTIKFPDGEEYDIEDGAVVEDVPDEEIEIPDDEEIEGIPDDEEIEEIPDEEDETEIEIIPGCECCDEENINFYQDNITNLKESNDFRWWVHQDEDRLKKVEDKLEDCGLNPTTDTNDKFDITRGVYEDVSKFMIIAFDEVGQDWIDDGKPDRGLLEFKIPTKNGWNPRGRDGQGSGDYGAGRGRRSHKGIDIKSTAGDEIVSPIDGYVSKVGYRIYGNKCGYLKGVDIKGTGEYEGIKIRLFYVKSDLEKNAKVEKGKKIGTQQSLNNNCYPQKKDGVYTMHNHVHIEVYHNGSIKNPTNGVYVDWME